MHFECTIATPAPARIRCRPPLDTVDLLEPLVSLSLWTRPACELPLDIPITLHRRLRVAAARQGTSVRHLILRSIEHTVQDISPHQPKRCLRLDPAIVPSTGKPFDLTNEQIFDLIAFP